MEIKKLEKYLIKNRCVIIIKESQQKDNWGKNERRKRKSMPKDLIIRSSSAEFLIFERQKGEKGIEVRFEDGDLWLTQKAIADLFDTSKQDVSYHLKNIIQTTIILMQLFLLDLE